MKQTDTELENTIYAVLRRCPTSMDDFVVAKKITTAIIHAEVQELSELTIAPAKSEPEDGG